MKLVLAADIIRHADRTPVHHIPGLSTTALEKENMGMLTPQGEKNALELGKKF